MSEHKEGYFQALADMRESIDNATANDARQHWDTELLDLMIRLQDDYCRDNEQTNPFERIENAQIAAAETAPSWKHRCYAIMGALGLDYGDPDFLMPDEANRLQNLVDLADNLRAAQKAYMANRGDEALGKAVGDAARAYDEARASK